MSRCAPARGGPLLERLDKAAAGYPQADRFATFGLGIQTDADDSEVRRALWARVADPYHDARDEAVVALARRGDRQILPVIADLLTLPSAGTLIFDAAAHLGDPALLPLLQRFDSSDNDVYAAIQACPRQQQLP